jgi:hypothetical protein
VEKKAEELKKKINRWSELESLGDFFELVTLDDVALFVFVEVAETDTALQSLAHFRNVLLEAFERDDGSVVNRLFAADDARST